MNDGIPAVILFMWIIGVLASLAVTGVIIWAIVKAVNYFL